MSTLEISLTLDSFFRSLLYGLREDANCIEADKGSVFDKELLVKGATVHNL